VLGECRLARFVVSPPREVLLERIDARLSVMVEQGILDEARALVGLDSSLPAAKALGVPELIRHLKGEIGLAEALDAVRIATRQYAKRQQTWFRTRMKDWKWLEDANISNLITQTT
jgi:tRNA dimethylallyltransferase